MAVVSTPADTDMLGLLRSSVRRFLDREFVPHIDDWRRSGSVPRAFFRLAGDHGLLCPSVPEEFGGAGGDFRHNVVINEEVVRSGVLPVALQVHSDIVAHYLLNWGSEAQKHKWLPGMVSGEVLAAIAMTEPDAGSDLQAIRASAKLSGDGYVINGAKTFISNGQNCDLIIVVAKTDPLAKGRGISLFLVEATQQGVRRGRKLEKMGGREQDTSELFFDDVLVPASMRLGAEGEGFKILMSELPRERLSIATSAVAAAELALSITLDYVKTRKAFGKPLIEFQNTAFKLAELRAQVRMARIYVDACVNRLMEEQFTAVDGAEAKLVTTQLQCKVADECLQMHGGNGWMDEYLISRLFTDARVQRIYGGTDEILKLVISRTL
nr:acyl-CoA dehydrogenase family protein [Peristeroidobacter agariperforans]